MINILIRFFAIISVFLSLSIAAAPTTIKCHVELLGGKQKIHEITYEYSDIPVQQVKSELAGYKIYTGDTAKKQAIYKVHECVKAESKFEKKSARRIEASQAQ